MKNSEIFIRFELVTGDPCFAELPPNCAFFPSTGSTVISAPAPFLFSQRRYWKQTGDKNNKRVPRARIQATPNIISAPLLSLV